jgi:hypothetical protein
MTGMRLIQNEGKAWNPLQSIRDREVHEQENKWIPEC